EDVVDKEAGLLADARLAVACLEVEFTAGHGSTTGVGTRDVHPLRVRDLGNRCDRDPVVGLLPDGDLDGLRRFISGELDPRGDLVGLALLEQAVDRGLHTVPVVLTPRDDHAAVALVPLFGDRDACVTAPNPWGGLAVLEVRA